MNKHKEYSDQEEIFGDYVTEDQDDANIEDSGVVSRIFRTFCSRHVVLVLVLP